MEEGRDEYLLYLYYSSPKTFLTKSAEFESKRRVYLHSCTKYNLDKPAKKVIVIRKESCSKM